MAREETPKLTFTRSFRGYDPQEVDDYVARVTVYAQQLEERANVAERSLEKLGVELTEARRRLAADGGGELPARLAQILALAEEEAHEIREQARAEVRAITEQASRDAEQTLNEAVQERMAIAGQVQKLSATREAFVNDLNRLSAQIAEAAQKDDVGLDSGMDSELQLTVFDAEASIDAEAPVDTEALVDDAAPAGAPAEVTAVRD